MTIRNKPRPCCYLCGSTGTTVHPQLTDHLFGVPGEWSHRECPNPDCGLVWLDPCPIDEDIGKLYESYYTHYPQAKSSAATRSDPATFQILRLLYSVLERMLLLRRARRKLNSLYLAGTRPGRLLEIGCGDGRRLARLRRKGWSVEGQEVDSKAAAHATRRFVLDVHVGHIDDLKLPGDSYDAIAMNHVVEHLADPVDVLRECYRLLKPGGQLVVITPNAKSLGHKVYGTSWRGLEPPRHLNLFSTITLPLTAAQAGFTSSCCRTTAAKAETFALGSLALKYDMPPATLPTRLRIAAISFQIRAWLHQLIDSDSGEECILLAKKILPGGPTRKQV